MHGSADFLFATVSHPVLFVFLFSFHFIMSRIFIISAIFFFLDAAPLTLRDSECVLCFELYSNIPRSTSAPPRWPRRGVHLNPSLIGATTAPDCFRRDSNYSGPCSLQPARKRRGGGGGRVRKRTTERETNCTKMRAPTIQINKNSQATQNNLKKKDPQKIEKKVMKNSSKILKQLLKILER